MPGREEVAGPFEALALGRRHVHGRAGRLGQLGDAGDVVDVAVGHEDRDAAGACQGLVDHRGLPGPAGVDHDRLGGVGAADDVAVGLVRAQRELLDLEGHRGVSLLARSARPRPGHVAPRGH